MAECMKDGVDCPDFYKCTEEGREALRRFLKEVQHES